MAINAPVQLGYLDDLSGNTHAFTVPAGGVPAGALLVVRALFKNLTNPSATVADSKSNTYTNDGNGISSNANIFIFSTVVTTPLLSGDTITLTIGSGTVGVYFGAYTYWTADGGWLVPQTDKKSVTNGTTASTWTSGTTATTSQANELLVGFCASSSASTSSTPSGSWVEEYDQTAADFPADRVVAQYQVVSSAGAYQANGTWSTGTATYTALIATYMPAPAGVANTMAPSGSITPVGVVAKQAGKPLVGSVTPIGVAARTCSRLLAGVCAPTGVASRLTGKRLAGSSAPSGAASRLVRKFLTGTSIPNGVAAVFVAVIRLFGFDRRGPTAATGGGNAKSGGFDNTAPK